MIMTIQFLGRMKNLLGSVQAVHRKTLQCETSIFQTSNHDWLPTNKAYLTNEPMGKNIGINRGRFV